MLYKEDADNMKQRDVVTAKKKKHALLFEQILGLFLIYI